MSWLSDRKAKRADKAATKEYTRLHAIWQEDVETLTKLITVFTAASNGKFLVRWFKKIIINLFTIYYFIMSAVSIGKFA